MGGDDERTLDGGCACGAIRFRVDGELDDVGYCHCRMCQRASGAPVMVFGTVARSALAWTRGTPRDRRSSSFGNRMFCGDCGTQLAMRVEHEPDTIDIAVVALDEPACVPPMFHIWDESRIPWFVVGDTCPRHARARDA